MVNRSVSTQRGQILLREHIGASHGSVFTEPAFSYFFFLRSAFSYLSNNLSSFTSEQLHFMQQHLQATTKSSKTFLQPHTIVPFLFVFLFWAGSLSQSPSSLSIITLLPLEGKKPLPQLSLSLSDPAATMSGLYSQGFSPARTLSPQIRSNPDADRYC